MAPLIAQLESSRKRAAVHTYTSTLHSFIRFATQSKTSLAIEEVFTLGRLKAYQEHLRAGQLKWNTVSTYMRTLQAVYNRLVVARQCKYIPSLFKDVYTKVVPLTKRALTEDKLNPTMNADFATLSLLAPSAGLLLTPFPAERHALYQPGLHAERRPAKKPAWQPLPHLLPTQNGKNDAHTRPTPSDGTPTDLSKQG